MTVKREKLTVDVYYASETAEGKNVAKITVVTYNTETGAEVQASTIVRKGDASGGSTRLNTSLFSMQLTRCC